LPATPPDAAASGDGEPWWQRMLREMWGEMKQLIRIEVADRPAAPLVPAAQQYFLRENLRLRLLTARIALLMRNDASFQADLTAAGNWVAQYFDTRTKSVQGLQATLKQLIGTPMAGEVPDLTRSLEALRVLRVAQDRAAGRAQPAPPAPPAKAR
jgi:uroporphyrin-III C-methyltransferase